MVLWLGFRVRTMLITHQLLLTMLTLSQELFSFLSWLATRNWGAQRDGRGQNQDSSPKLARRISHTYGIIVRWPGLHCWASISWWWTNEFYAVGWFVFLFFVCFFFSFSFFVLLNTLYLNPHVFALLTFSVLSSSPLLGEQMSSWMVLSCLIKQTNSSIPGKTGEEKKEKPLNK